MQEGSFKLQCRAKLRSVFTGEQEEVLPLKREAAVLAQACMPAPGGASDSSSSVESRPVLKGGTPFHSGGTLARMRGRGSATARTPSAAAYQQATVSFMTQIGQATSGKRLSSTRTEGATMHAQHTIKGNALIYNQAMH